MSFFNLNTDKCKKDGICSAVCVAGIIKNDDNRQPFIEDGKDSRCISCGHCVAFCPHEACHVKNLNTSMFYKLKKEDIISQEQADIFLKTRRSIRNFKDKLVDQDTLDKILSVTSYAPSAKNKHHERWIITTSREKTKLLADMVIDFLSNNLNNMEQTESVFAKLLVRAYKSGKDVIMRDAGQIAIMVMPKDVEFSTEDGTIALTYFELAAHGHGLGCVWAGYFTEVAKKCQKIKDFLNIDDKETVIGAQLFGYPLYKVRQVTSRHKPNVVLI